MDRMLAKILLAQRGRAQTSFARACWYDRVRAMYVPFESWSGDLVDYLEACACPVTEGISRLLYIEAYVKRYSAVTRENAKATLKQVMRANAQLPTVELLVNDRRNARVQRRKAAARAAV